MLLTSWSLYMMTIGVGALKNNSKQDTVLLVGQ